MERRRISKRDLLWQYGLAIAAVGLGVLLTRLLWLVIKPELSPFFFAAVIAAASFGGLGPGLLATFLSAIAINYFFIAPKAIPVIDFGDLLQLALFALVALPVSSLAQGRRRREQELHESDLRFRSVAQAANDAIIAADSRGQIFFWNKGAEVMFGYKENEAIHKSLTLLIPVRYREAHCKALEKLSATGNASMIGKTIELSGLRKDGSEFPLELSLATWQTSKGPSYSGVIRDRTRQKQTEEMLQKSQANLEKRVEERTAALSQTNRELRDEISARQKAEQMLRESQERSRRAFHYAPIGMAILDLDGRRLQVNPALCKILGYSNEELLTHTFQSTTYPDDLAEDLKQMEQLLAGAFLSFQQERRYIHKLGHVIWTVRSMSLMRDSHGKPLHFITQVEDITERKKMQEERQRLLHDLGERVKELTALHQTARLLEDYQKTTSQLLEDIAAILPPAWQYPDLAAARILFDGMEYKTPNFLPTRWTLRTDFTTPRGTHGEVEVVYLNEPTIRSDEPFLIEEKRLLDSLAEMLRLHFGRKESKERADQVTQELIERNNDLLNLQQEMGRVEPLAALGRMTAAIAHELGTPLNSVMGYTHLLGQEELTESARRRVKMIETQTQRMASIVQFYLDRTRDPSRKFSPINLNELIKDTLQLLRPILDQKGVEITLALAESLPLLNAHSASLQRVFINLLNNAMDALKEAGTIKITTRKTTSLERPHPGIMTEVTDTGEGIPPELLPGIFDLFVTTKAPGKGTGLGLTICQEIVKAHEGNIEITSEIREGTCVRIFLPTGRPAPQVPSAEGKV